MIADLIILGLILAAAISGARSGFLRRFGAGVGFIIGLFIGRFLGQYTLKIVESPDERALVAMATLLGFAILVLIGGELLGSLAKHRLNLSQYQRLNQIDNWFGSLLSVIVILVGLWLLSGVLNTMPSRDLRNMLNGSKVVSALNQLMPPVPHSISSLSYLIDPNTFPDVFLGNEPIPEGKVELPELGELEAAVNATKNSVVRIKGQGCGGIVSGSGFVVGNGMVATNAHVVAGIAKPYVQDSAGTHKATTIWFDPKLDLAILRASDLTGSPLVLSSTAIKPGTAAAALGYPDGGQFEATPAAVLRSLKARGRDIYNQQQTLRTIYEVQSKIVHGNSGGPLVDKQGQVIGVVFAESTNYQELGYALTNDQVIPAVTQAAARLQPVSTGQCAGRE